MDSKKLLILYCAKAAKIEVIDPLRWNQSEADSVGGLRAEQRDRGPTTMANTHKTTMKDNSALRFVVVATGMYVRRLTFELSRAWRQGA